MKIGLNKIQHYWPLFQRVFFVLATIFLLATALIAINAVVVGNFAFWYDPARDLLAALANLHKPTLIGPPSGIPGIFYGPYWIWLLSIGLFFTKDPRVALGLVGLLPYLILFPYFLFQFRKIFNTQIIFLLLIFFSLGGFYTYATNLWNPNLAPFFFLPLVLSLLAVTFDNITFSTYGFTFLSGLLVGIIMNFHLSFGIGVLGGTSAFLLAYGIVTLTRQKHFVLSRTLQIGASLLVYFLGIGIIFTPFFLFEMRHNFLQTHHLIKTITDATLYDTAAVGQKGLSKLTIIRTFVGNFGASVKISEITVYLVALATLFYSVSLWRRKKIASVILPVKKQLTGQKGKLLAILLLILSATAGLYLSSKNPVWSYHFIGSDILFLLLIGLLMKLSQKLEKVILVWAIGIMIFALPHLWQNLTTLGKINPLISSFSMKKQAVDTIYQDAHNQPFLVAAYNPALYTYDYDYLFQWKGQKTLLKDPQVVMKSNLPIYLLVPRKDMAHRLDFIHYMATDSAFMTSKVMTVGGDIEIIKREKK